MVKWASSLGQPMAGHLRRPWKLRALVEEQLSLVFIYISFRTFAKWRSGLKSYPNTPWDCKCDLHVRDLGVNVDRVFGGIPTIRDLSPGLPIWIPEISSFGPLRWGMRQDHQSPILLAFHQALLTLD